MDHATAIQFFDFNSVEDLDFRLCFSLENIQSLFIDENSKRGEKMSQRAYIGADNGITGSLAIVHPMNTDFVIMPVQKEQNYTKKKRLITRVDWKVLEKVLEAWCKVADVRVFLERPYTGVQTFTVISAMRCLEAVLICIERLGLSYQYVDSKSWQKVMLPKGTNGSTDLKKASVDIGCRLFPQFAGLIRKQKDADSLLIAEWARRGDL